MTGENSPRRAAAPAGARRLDPDVYGDPEKTPFVRYVSGTPVYPPNTVYDAARKLLEYPEDTNLAEVCKGLTERGAVGGQYAVLPHSTWFAILQILFGYNLTTSETRITDWQHRCRRALEIMQEQSHRAAWDKLKAFLKSDIDNLSGWNSSWRKSSAERDQIFRGEDGNYYYHDEEGILIQVIGGRTLEETRLDFITDQLVHSYGVLHQFIALFSLFAIADDYAQNTARYPRSMRAVLSEQDFARIFHRWHFTFIERTRTVRWRPDSNACDPDWLVADLLGEITDTLKIDYWRQRHDMTRPDSTWMEPECTYQADYVLDSALVLGPNAELLIEFEGKRFRWFNGTLERNAVVSMGVKDPRNSEPENDKLNRLLTALVWEHKVPIRKLWGAGGPRRPYPTVHGPRQSGGIQVDPTYIQHGLQQPRTPRQWFALALFKEGINSRSKFYSFLCFWKVIELAYPRVDDRKQWVKNVAAAATREKETLSRILQYTKDLEAYLRDERRHAVAHVFQEKRAGSKKGDRPVNPDDPKHEASINHDIRLIEDFARQAIEEMLK